MVSYCIDTPVFPLEFKKWVYTRILDVTTKQLLTGDHTD